VPAVQSLFGHSSITRTMDLYAHLLEDVGNNAMEELEESLR
jgi:integrase